ncbi:MAG: alpha/beta fold hydrolase [Kofleriaceae bacterium]
MSTLVANGIAHHVQELGDPAAPPVVMIHGLVIGSLASWFFTIGPALARTRRVRMYDLRAHGRSARVPTGFDTQTLAADLNALTADLPAFDLVGHSWGALVALRFSLAHPDRVRKLVVVEAPIPPSSATELASFITADPAKIADALPDSLKTAVATGRRQAARLVESVIYLARDTSLLQDIRNEPEPDVANLQPDTLCLYGDTSSCLAGATKIIDTAPRAKLRVLHGGHYLHLDARADMLAAIEAHLG